MSQCQLLLQLTFQMIKKEIIHLNSQCISVSCWLDTYKQWGLGWLGVNWQCFACHKYHLIPLFVYHRWTNVMYVFGMYRYTSFIFSGSSMTFQCSKDFIWETVVFVCLCFIICVVVLFIFVFTVTSGMASLNVQNVCVEILFISNGISKVWIWERSSRRLTLFNG